MTLQEIKTAITKGERVFWVNGAYEVIKNNNDEYFIKSSTGLLSLIWADGITTDYKMEDFHVGS